jgi:hypothetical protein
MLLLCLLSPPAGAGDPAFVDRAAADFDFGTPDGGLSVIDYDLDGFLDLVVGDGVGAPIHLFHNEPDPLHPGRRTFVERTVGSGLDDAEAVARASGGLVVADYDGDGLSDVFAAGWSSSDGTSGLLYRNEGSGKFANVSVAAGVRHLSRAESASWTDFDLDSDLDLFIAARSGAGGNFRLFENQGDGTFLDATARLPATPSFSIPYAHGWLDYDEDGWADCFVLVQGGPVNIVFQNVDDGQGGRTFVNVAQAIGFGPLGSAPMGIAFGDYDGDGRLDIGVSNANSGTYFRDNGPGFTKVQPFTSIFGWGNAWVDVENDADVDYFMAGSWSVFAPNKLFRNEGGGMFVDDSAALNGLSFPSRYSVQIDYQNDGLVDLAVVNPNQPGVRMHFYENVSTGAGHWSRVRLVGDGQRVHGAAVGALVRLRAGGATQVRQVAIGTSTSSTEDLRAHFGLGSATVVDEIEVVWPRRGSPASRTEVFTGPFAADAEIVLAPRLYAPFCSAKPSSCGTLPAIAASGWPSAGATSGFVVRAERTQAGKGGLLIYADGGPASVPFQGGTLCVDPATLRRSVAVVDTSGTGPACDGVLALDVNAFAAGKLGGHPAAFLSVPGTVVWCQYWARDTLAHGSLLSDALAFFVDP